MATRWEIGDLTGCRENWQGHYKTVIRKKGRFYKIQDWSPKQPVETVLTYYAQVEWEKAAPPEKCYHVHAKLRMTRGNKGGTIEMEAYNYVKATDEGTAKDLLEQQINSMFSSGDHVFCEITDIKLFANEIPCKEMEDSGLIKWRASEKESWRQETIEGYT